MPVREFIDWNTVTADSFSRYEKVRKSGVTNMFDVGYVEQLSGLDRDVIMAIMEHYGELDEKYPEVRNPQPAKPKLEARPGVCDAIAYKLPDFTWEQVDSAYIGIPHRCMCGCSGDYAYTSNNRNKSGLARGYDIEDGEINDRKVRTRINKMRQHESDGIEVIEDYIFTEYIGNRQYTLYLFKK